MRTIVYYCILVVCIFALEFTTLFSPITKFGAFLSAAVHSTTYHAQGGPQFCATCAVDTARLHALEDENANLKNQLSYAQRTKQMPLVAQRIGRSTDAIQSETVIDRGSQDGIAVGDPVTAGDGILVGTVIKVERAQSFVLPLTDPRSKILASILQEKKEIRGIAEGQFNTGLSMTLIPISDELKKDDLVVTSGLQDAIPAGLVIGTVEDIQKKPEDLFQSAILRIAASINDSALVSVLIQANGKK